MDNDLVYFKLKKSSCFFEAFKLVWMPLLVLVGVVAGFFEIVPLNVGIHTLIMISMIFVIFIFFIKHNALFLACRFNNSDDMIRDELNTFFKKNAYKIGEEKKATGSIEPLFLDIYNSFRNDNFASVAATIFPTLGILGTFISIAISMPDFSVDTSEALEKEISLLLSGVGTAFYVSIYGIFLSLWWIFFEKRGLSRFEKDVNTLIKSCASYIWSKEEIDEARHQESLNMQLQSISVQKSMLEKITLFSTDAYVDMMKKMVNDHMELFRSITDNERVVYKESMSQLISQQEMAKESMETLMSGYIENFKNVSMQEQKLLSESSVSIQAQQELMLKEINSLMLGYVDQFKELSANEAQMLHSSAAELKSQQDDVKKSMNYIIKMHMDSFEKMITGEKEMFDEAYKNIANLSQSIKHGSDMHLSMVEKYESIETIMKQVDDSLIKNSETLSSISSEFEHQKNEINSSIRNFTAVVEKSLNSISDQNDQTVKEKAQMLKTFNHMIQANSDFTGLYAAQNSQLIESLEDIVRKLQQISTRAES
jgi:hypothetical protein